MDLRTPNRTLEELKPGRQSLVAVEAYSQSHLRGIETFEATQRR